MKQQQVMAFHKRAYRPKGTSVSLALCGYRQVTTQNTIHTVTRSFLLKC